MIRSIIWKSPPNLAIVKYWGKKEGQIPLNPSLSFVLDNLATITRIRYSCTNRGGGLGKVMFNDRVNEQFTLRLQTYLDSVYQVFPGLRKIHIEIDTRNSFPHGAGIASSASGFSALGLCITSLAEELHEEILPGLNFLQRASWLARLGSGSASRSVFPGFSVWGETPLWEGANNLFACPVTHGVSELFFSLRNTVLLVHEVPKAVSSTEGHRLMDRHPYAGGRFNQAVTNLSRLKSCLKINDPFEFVTITEEESLSIHALMMSAVPGYWLFQPTTLLLMQTIRQFREDSGIAVGFSLDAGANVHFLWFEKDREVVQRFLYDHISRHCPPERWLASGIGLGAERIC